MVPATCKVSPLGKILSLAEPHIRPASCKVCCLEIMKESPGKAFRAWELTSLRVPGGDSLVGPGLQMLQSSAFPATEHLCRGFQLHLLQAPVSAHHEHAPFLSRLLQHHLWCFQPADAPRVPMYFIGESHNIQARCTESGMGSWALRLVLVWKFVVRNVESDRVCNLQNILLELKVQGFVLYKHIRENKTPALKLSLLLWVVWKTRSFPGSLLLLFIHLLSNACTPLSRYESATC